MNNCKYCEKEIKTYDKVIIIHKDCFDKISDLEAKLAESEKELNRYAELFGMKDKDFYVVEKTEYEKMKQGAKDIVMQLKQQLAEKDKLLSMYPRIEDMYPPQMIKLANQDKISLAVEQLEKLKNRAKEYKKEFLKKDEDISSFDMFRMIDWLITQLKEGK